MLGEITERMQIISTPCAWCFVASKALVTLVTRSSSLIVFIASVVDITFLTPRGLTARLLILGSVPNSAPNSWSPRQRLTWVTPLDMDDRWWNRGFIYLELPRKEQAWEKHVSWKAFIRQAWALSRHSSEHGIQTSWLSTLRDDTLQTRRDTAKH